MCVCVCLPALSMYLSQAAIIAGPLSTPCPLAALAPSDLRSIGGSNTLGMIPHWPLSLGSRCSLITSVVLAGRRSLFKNILLSPRTALLSCFICVWALPPTRGQWIPSLLPTVADRALYFSTPKPATRWTNTVQ